MLDHRAARRRTILAGLGTVRHVLIVGRFRTGRAALVAGFGARLAYDARKRAVTRGQLGSRRADLGAVVAQNHRLGMILLASADQPNAMMVAGCARIRTVRTCLRAGVEYHAVVVRLLPGEGARCTTATKGESQNGE